MLEPAGSSTSRLCYVVVLGLAFILSGHCFCSFRVAPGFRLTAGGASQPPRALVRIEMERPKSRDATIALARSYAIARDLRTRLGHEAACPHYQDVLKLNPEDRTAGTRLAASLLTDMQHEQACGGNQTLLERQSIMKARDLLIRHNYSHHDIAKFFGVQPRENSTNIISCEGPLFVSPVTPGSVTAANYPFSYSKEDSSALSYLISLFLLGLVVPKKWIQEAMGEKSTALMEELGWAFPCSIDPSLMVPYVHIFPLDFNLKRPSQNPSTLFFVTDLHPDVTSTTSVGNGLDPTGNVVMYIGPDSLALVQHFNPYAGVAATVSDPQSKIPLHLLDLGTGSGILALSALKHWELARNHTTNTHFTRSLEVVAVDVNPRALRFTRFNAILNGLDDHLSLIWADLSSGFCLDSSSPRQLKKRLLRNKYHFMLANPPFLPVPSSGRVVDVNSDQLDRDGRTSRTLDTIGQRYGLFSSGGASGEGILRQILKIASFHLEEGGILGIVSEFFAKPTDPKFERFGRWWLDELPFDSIHDNNNATATMSSATGVLFLNEYQLDPLTYAGRRADNPIEKRIWHQHLESLGVSSISPGLLYIYKDKTHLASIEKACLHLSISSVPKTEMGSIWTPSNLHAISFTQKNCREMINRQL